MLRLNENLGMDYRIFAEGLKMVDESDFRPYYSQANCRIDLIVGENDVCILPESYSMIEALADDIHVHVIPDAGHNLLLTHINEFHALVDRVLGRDGV